LVENRMARAGIAVYAAVALCLLIAGSTVSVARRVTRTSSSARRIDAVRSASTASHNGQGHEAAASHKSVSRVRHAHAATAAAAVEVSGELSVGSGYSIMNCTSNLGSMGCGPGNVGPNCCCPACHGTFSNHATATLEAVGAACGCPGNAPTSQQALSCTCYWVSSSDDDDHQNVVVHNDDDHFPPP